MGGALRGHDRRYDDDGTPTPSITTNVSVDLGATGDRAAIILLRCSRASPTSRCQPIISGRCGPRRALRQVPGRFRERHAPELYGGSAATC